MGKDASHESRRNMFASSGPNGDPIAPPSTWAYMLSLKLNSTARVAAFMSSTKTASEIEGGSRSLLNGDAVHIFTVSWRGKRW